MFRRIELSNYYLMLHPRPAVLVLTLCPKEKINVMAISWITPISEEPPTLGMAIDKEAYTNTCLEYCPEVTINIPSIDYRDLVLSVGSVSGRDVDKVKVFNIKLSSANKVKVPVWSDALGIIEGRVSKVIDIGEVRFYVVEVLDAYVKKGTFTKWGWNLSKVNPILHGSGKVFYSPGRVFMAKKLK